MADVKETLVKEAIRKAEEEAARKAEQEAGKEEAEDGQEAEKAEAGGTDETGEEAAQDAGTEENTGPDEASEENGENDGNNADEPNTGKKKPGLFGKKNKKDPRDEKIEELNDKLLRNLAEFENFRKRNEKEKSQMFDMGAKSIIEKILPAIDSFERGLKSLSDEDKASPIAEGMEKIYRQLAGSLEEAGLEPIEAVGAEFDPNLHNAVMHEDNDELGENVVSEELQKGYMYRGSVVRHSMVKVAN
ncbi:MAG: nucleotide exchange factor GrpE [Lachnospiraceae bacterium]|nr:nucleotide exchange factor GrpE [Lachnospiraceae bacterium]